MPWYRRQVFPEVSEGDASSDADYNNCFHSSIKWVPRGNWRSGVTVNTCPKREIIIPERLRVRLVAKFDSGARDSKVATSNGFPITRYYPEIGSDQFRKPEWRRRWKILRGECNHFPYIHWSNSPRRTPSGLLNWSGQSARTGVCDVLEETLARPTMEIR